MIALVHQGDRGGALVLSAGRAHGTIPTPCGVGCNVPPAATRRRALAYRHLWLHRVGGQTNRASFPLSMIPGQRHNRIVRGSGSPHNLHSSLARLPAARHRLACNFFLNGAFLACPETGFSGLIGLAGLRFQSPMERDQRLVCEPASRFLFTRSVVNNHVILGFGFKVLVYGVSNGMLFGWCVLGRNERVTPSHVFAKISINEEV